MRSTDGEEKKTQIPASCTQGAHSSHTHHGGGGVCFYDIQVRRQWRINFRKWNQQCLIKLLSVPFN